MVDPYEATPIQGGSTPWHYLLSFGTKTLGKIIICNITIPTKKLQLLPATADDQTAIEGNVTNIFSLTLPHSPSAPKLLANNQIAIEAMQPTSYSLTLPCLPWHQDPWWHQQPQYHHPNLEEVAAILDCG